MEKNTSDN